MEDEKQAEQNMWVNLTQVAQKMEMSPHEVINFAADNGEFLGKYIVRDPKVKNPINFPIVPKDGNSENFTREIANQLQDASEKKAEDKLAEHYLVPLGWAKSVVELKNDS